MTESDVYNRQADVNYQNIFEKAVVGIAQVTPEGTCLSANQTLARIHGFDSPEEMIESVNNIEWQLYVNSEDRRDFMRLFETQDVVKDYEVKLYRKDKSIIWASMNTRAVRDFDGKIFYYESIVQDITERKRLESHILLSQKMEAIGTLAGGMAHDFNNLLMGIQGYVSLMLYSMEQNHAHYDKLKHIEELIRSGADLTKELLEFARGGAYEPKPTDLNEVLDKASTMFGRTKRELAIHKKYEANLYTVEVDQSQIERVFLNVCINAWQAISAGGELCLETNNVTLDETYVKPYSVSPGKYVKISLTDTGPGMDEGAKEKIFEPFFTINEMGRGSGLGLASAYGTIKNHRGFIDVSSEKGCGTRFDIYLPASVRDIETEEVIPETEVPAETETVLIVDDEKTVLMVSTELLEALGYGVLAAWNGKEALDLYERQKDKIDVVILDMVMPDMGGGEVFEAMKKMNPDVKVILSSGYTLDGQTSGIMNRGCKAFIQKPFSMDDLSKKIREVLDAK
jgi:two-component system, cell cycle sensor histidine kinase and response regulator CckA